MNIDEMADLMEKSIVILGQATVMSSYFRRIQVMAKFLRSNSRAEKQVRQNSIGYLVECWKYTVWYSVFVDYIFFLIMLTDGTLQQRYVYLDNCSSESCKALQPYPQYVHRCCGSPPCVRGAPPHTSHSGP
jgi:hypothetical protein